MHANDIALDRNWATADSCTVTNFGDCVRVDLRWTDGGYAYSLEDTRAEAVAFAARMGFGPKATP